MTKVLELGSGSCSPPPKTTDTTLTRCCCRTATETEDNETALLSKWRNSHTARLPKAFNVTRWRLGERQLPTPQVEGYQQAAAETLVMVARLRSSRRELGWFSIFKPGFDSR